MAMKRVVHIINNQTCKDEEIMQLVREMVETLMQRNILFRAVHKKGILNLTADFLSRIHADKNEMNRALGHFCAHIG